MFVSNDDHPIDIKLVALLGVLCDIFMQLVYCLAINLIYGEGDLKTIWGLIFLGNLMGF